MISGYNNSEMKRNKMSYILNHIQNRWTKSKSNVTNLIWSYFIHKQDLTFNNGNIFKGIHMIVPKTLCEDMKHLLPIGHLGIVKIKEKAPWY